MFKNFFVIFTLISVVGFLYGLFNVFVEVGPNECRMTYMFSPPQFSQIHLRKNAAFASYGLYYYNEGRLPKSENNLNLNGAPVIFIPGNGGSYKQVRSLASVALQKGKNQAKGIHLDFFTLNFNEELSALYGAYLERQTIFLKQCILAVLKLYKDYAISDRKVILIGHSMGGKVAQAVLTDENISKVINTIIFVSTPVDKPVLNLDEKINDFYTRTNNYMNSNRDQFQVDNSTNICGNFPYIAANRHNTNNYLLNVLMISIGGGSRDVLVQSGLTSSKFSDIHALTYSIPNVWLSCDHLSAVWCLQLVLVINRFLFSISSLNREHYVYFNENRAFRLQKALNYFTKSRLQSENNEIDFLKKFVNDIIWHEESRRVFTKHLNDGLKHNYVQMIPLTKQANFKIMYLEINNMGEHDMLLGCVAKATSSQKKYCINGISLSHYFQDIPSVNNKRTMALINIQNIRKTYTNWTHVAVMLRSTRKPVQYNVDIHNPTERHLYLKARRWFGMQEVNLINETVQGAAYYKIFIKDVRETFETIQLKIKPLICSDNSNSVTIRICIPWAPGFNRYQVLPGNSSSESVYVSVPIAAPNGYNTTTNPIVLEIFLHPSCRYSMSYKFSIEVTLSRIVQQFYHWLPSHVTAVILIILKSQILELNNLNNAKSMTPYKGFFQYSSFFIITGCRIFKNLPGVDVLNHSLISVAIIHSASIMISIVMCFVIWGLLILFGNTLSKIISRCFPVFIFESLMDKLPIIFGVLIISLAIKTCSEIALITTCVVYLFLISNAYRNYIENWLWMTAMILFKKLRKEETELRLNKYSLIHCDGMNNFSFHIALFILLLILTFLNTMTAVAWIREYSYKNGSYFYDPALTTSVTALAALCLLWQLKAPTKIPSFRFGYKAISAVIYICAIGSVIYCQEAVYRLNYIIAFAYVVLLVQEIMCRIWTYYENKLK